MEAKYTRVQKKEGKQHRITLYLSNDEEKRIERDRSSFPRKPSMATYVEMAIRNYLEVTK